MTTHWQPIDDAAGIYRGTYEFGDNTVSSTAVRVGDGRVMVYGAGIDTTDEAFAELDALGEVVAVLAPGSFHHLGLPKWRARYPDAKVIASAGGRVRIQKQHKKVELGLEGVEALAPLLPDHVHVVDVEGMKQADLHVAVRGADQSCTWLTNEVISNEPELPKPFLFRTMFKLFGVGPGLEINTLALRLTGGKKPAVAQFYRRQLESHRPTRLIPSHGRPLESDDLPEQLGALFDRRL